jgi:hypothetical protein
MYQARISELLEFWTFSIIQYSKTRKNISETASIHILRWRGKTPTLLGYLERGNLNYWTMDKVQKPINSES